MTLEEHVLKHFGNPYHKRSMRGEDNLHSGTAISDACGDQVNFEARIEEGMLVEIWWESQGCCYTQAAASMLAEYAEGRPATEMLNFDEYAMLNLFQLDVSTNRMSCVLVSLNAFHNLLETL